VATYLAFAISKLADRGSTICTWFTERDSTRNTFARQAIPMTWDFAELNVLLAGTGSFEGAAAWTAESVAALAVGPAGTARQADASALAPPTGCVSTDPPYYDNIGYADLSDFFYVWLRRSLGSVYPDLFGTVLTPKAAELVATPYRFDGDKTRAEAHFEHGLGAAFARIREVSDPSVPVTIYYAFKQAESDGGGATASTGWETMLEGLLEAGFAIDGTWPMRSELGNRMIASGTNALASSIVLVCRPRSQSAPLATYREFVQALSVELPAALAKLQQSNIAPVDLAQAAIGPGMAIFTRYSGILEQATGGRMSVRRALELINAELDSYFSAENGDLDRDTRWCHTWFRNHGFSDGAYGSADTLATARNVSVAGLQESGVLVSGGGKVRLFRPRELNAAWDPLTDERLTVWECTHHLVRALHDPRGGIEGAARLAARMGEGRAAEAKDLAYGLFGISERGGWRDEAGDYNDLVIEWPAIAERAREIGATGRQDTLGI
jgi:putative DNA methylase